MIEFFTSPEVTVWFRLTTVLFLVVIGFMVASLWDRKAK